MVVDVWNRVLLLLLLPLQQVCNHKGCLLLLRRHCRVPRREGACALKTQAFFGFGKSGKSEADLEKEDQFNKQQEILASRRSGTWQKVCVSCAQAKAECAVYQKWRLTTMYVDGYARLYTNAEQK